MVLIGTAIAVVVEPGTAGMANPGAHGFSEVLYAFSSAGNNNGSAFAGLSANTPFYNTALGIAMWTSRYWLIVPVLALAGSLARKKLVPAGAGTLPTHTPLFIGFLVGTVLVVGALTFVPGLALGPIVEHLQLLEQVAMATPTQAIKTLSAPILTRAALESFTKLDPRVQWKNPVMFVVWVGAPAGDALDALS